MRAVLWLVALFGIAVAVALFAGNNQALVSIFWPPHRIDISLNLLLLLLAGFFALLYGALRALSALFALPGDARAWRTQQKERALYDALIDSLAHWLGGRYIRAARAAEQALLQEKSLVLMAGGDSNSASASPSADASLNGQGNALGLARASQARTLAHLLAAESAQSLQDKPLRESHLQQALHSSAAPRQSHSLRESVQFRAARWALEDRDPGAALDWLAQLPQGAARRTLALHLKLQAAQQARQPQQALETARLLAKHGAFSPAVAHSVVQGLVLECIASAADTAQLQQVWQSLDETERTRAEIAVFAASRLMALAAPQSAAEAEANATEPGMPAFNNPAIQVRAWLLPIWEQMFSPGGARTGLPGQQQSHFLQERNRLAVASIDPAGGDRGGDKRSRVFDVLEAGLDSIDALWLARIETAQQNQPHDAALCYLAGLACLHRQLWGKAQQLLERAAPGLQEQPALQRKAWRTLGQLLEQRGDEAAAAQAFKRSALVL